MPAHHVPAATRERWLVAASTKRQEEPARKLMVWRAKRVSVTYLSLQVSTDPGRRVRSDLPDERWFIDGRRTGTGGSSQWAEAALAESPRTLLREDAGSGKTTLLQWLAVTAARGRFSRPLADWNGCVPFLVRLRSYADRPLPRLEQLLTGVKLSLVTQGEASHGGTHARHLRACVATG